MSPNLNPMIEDAAESTISNVGAVLSALASMFEASEYDAENQMTLDVTASYGMALILRTCDQALRHAAGGAA